MTKRKPPPCSAEDASYEVGYCKPPKRTRFQPGQSGNPRGRPKKQKSFVAALEVALGAKVKLHRNGKERVVSSIEAIAYRLVMDAMQGKCSAQKLLVALMERFPTVVNAVRVEGEEDARDWLRETLEKMRQRMQQKLPGEK